MASIPGTKPGPHWWEASPLTTAPSLLPQEEHKKINIIIKTQLHRNFILRFQFYEDKQNASWGLHKPWQIV